LKKFTTNFLEEANQFLASLDRKSAAKLLFIIDAAESANNPKLFKKLNGKLWEFRSKYLGKQNRLLAFWDKSGKKETLVIATHGFVKKSRKTPLKEISKAEQLRELYFSNKSMK
jgi:phage-related protein